jgi:hypothetical protein
VCRCAATVLVFGLAACSITAGQCGERQGSLVIMERRTELEQQIYQALDERTECQFADTPLADVVDFFKAQHDIDIQIDFKAFQDEAVDASAPVSRTCRGVRLKSALRTILRDLNLTYVVRDEVLTITTRSAADEMMEIRTYPVSDLLGDPGEDPDFASLIQLITSTVDPPTWDENGGPGSIQPFYPRRVLAIAQTQEVHEHIAELFSQLRRAGPGGRDFEQAMSTTPRRRPVDHDRRYIADPQLAHIVGRLYSNKGKSEKATRD